MQQKAFSIALKSLGDDGTFEGIASTYGNVDQGGDVVEPGAFTQTLKNNKTRPLLWQHRDPIGVATLNDSAAGLVCRGDLCLDTQAGREAFALLKAKAVGGLSIGFSSIREEYKGDTRRLKEIKLYEVSIVTFPMNESALITATKAAARQKEISRALKEFRREILAALKG